MLKELEEKTKRTLQGLGREAGSDLNLHRNALGFELWLRLSHWIMISHNY